MTEERLAKIRAKQDEWDRKERAGVPIMSGYDPQTKELLAYVDELRDEVADLKRQLPTIFHT